MKWFLRSKGIKPTNNDIAVVDLRLPVAKPKDYENQDDGVFLANTITVVDRHVVNRSACQMAIGGKKGACPVCILHQGCDGQPCCTRAASNSTLPTPDL
jgi:hypothetical protein